MRRKITEAAARRRPGAGLAGLGPLLFVNGPKGLGKTELCDAIASVSFKGVMLGAGLTASFVHAQRLPNVDPVYTWVRLAQRVPVRIAIDSVPTGR
jgi:hypothetical protein